MGQIAYSVAGAAIGYYFGGPTGAKYGWAIGSAVGGVVSPPKGADGPRLGDLTVQSSAYGQPIPRLWGTQRIAGQVIWATPLVEQENEQGGKGGSSYSTYSYSCSFAVALCRGPIACIPRIWADGKLIYNIRAENTSNTVGFTALSMVVYPGSETQDVDPTIQAYLGDAPAYRGLCYVVFSGLQLERFGNRIPNLTFEVAQEAEIGLPEPVQFGEYYTGIGDDVFQCDFAENGYLWMSKMTGHAGINPDTGEPDVATEAEAIFYGGPEAQVQMYDPTQQKLVKFYTVPYETISNGASPGVTTTYPINGAGVCYGNNYYVGRGYAGAARDWVDVCPPPNGTFVCANQIPYTHATVYNEDGYLRLKDLASSGQFQNAFYHPTVVGRASEPLAPRSAPEVFYVFSGNGIVDTLGIGWVGGFQDRYDAKCKCDFFKYPGDEFDGRTPFFTTGDETFPPGWSYKATAVKDHALIQGYNPSGGSFLYLTPSALQRSPNADLTPIAGSQAFNRMPTCVVDPMRDTIWLWGSDRGGNGPEIYLYSYGRAIDVIGSPGEHFKLPAPYNSIAATVAAACFDSATGNLRLFLKSGFFDTWLLLFNPDSQQVVESQVVSSLEYSPVGFFANALGRMRDYPVQRAVCFSNGYNSYWIPYGQTCTPTPIPLWQIVREVSIEAGLTVDEIDTTELTDLVLGFVITRQGSARSAIEMLMSTFYFDAVESEGKVKFVKRGKPPALTIADEDLSAHAMTGEPPPPLSLTRADEADLPRVMGVRYINPDNDYQVNVQSAKRMTGLATAEVLLDAPVVLADSSAKALADAALYSAWAARTTARWSTTWKYAHVEPTDVVEISANPILVKKVTRSANLLSFEGVFDSGQTLTAGALSGSVYYPTGGGATPVETVALTTLLLLDIPLLQDAHEGPGYYAAVAPAGQPWTGAAITKSDDGGGTYSTIDSSSTAAVHGVAVDALGDFTPNMVDEFNVVTVVVNGTLSSSTELAMLNGANLALLGNELLQFKRATLNLDTTYTLSGLLRGRAGTPTGAHVTGERFVLVDAAIRRQAGSFAELTLSRLYKAVSFGGTFESASISYFANNAVGLRCLPPVLLGGGRDASGNLTISWVRRTRLDGQWRDSVDAGLGETVEAYEVEIMDAPGDAAVLRIIASSTSVASYTAAQQIADFGSEQATVYVRIYQLSATVGRGAKLEGAI